MGRVCTSPLFHHYWCFICTSWTTPFIVLINYQNVLENLSKAVWNKTTTFLTFPFLPCTKSKVIKKLYYSKSKKPVRKVNKIIQFTKLNLLLQLIILVVFLWLRLNLYILDRLSYIMPIMPSFIPCIVVITYTSLVLQITRKYPCIYPSIKHKYLNFDRKPRYGTAMWFQWHGNCCSCVGLVKNYLDDILLRVGQ